MPECPPDIIFPQLGKQQSQSTNNKQQVFEKEKKTTTFAIIKDGNSSVLLSEGQTRIIERITHCKNRRRPEFDTHFLENCLPSKDLEFIYLPFFFNIVQRRQMQSSVSGSMIDYMLFRKMKMVLLYLSSMGILIMATKKYA